MRNVLVPLVAANMLIVGSAALATSFTSGDATTTLHPGDKVAVTVYNHPELAATSTTVDSTGRITVPLAGLIDATNATPRQVALRVEERLARYVRKPAVDVQLLSQGQNLFVAGGPGGTYPYSPGETLTAALAQIQGSGPSAGPPGTGSAPAVTSNSPNVVSAHNLQYGSVDLRHVVIRRNGSRLAPVDAQRLIELGQPGPALQPDDTIELRAKPIAVAVKGEVVEPTVAHLDGAEPLSNALRQAGGTNGTSSSVAFVLQRNGTQKRITSSSPEYSAPAQPGDAIYVPHAARIGVVGMVEKPGDVSLAGDKTLLSALYFAGGPNKWGDIKHVTVVHDGVQQMIDVTKLTHGAESANPELSDGDTVFVPEGHKIDFSQVFASIFAATNLARIGR